MIVSEIKFLRKIVLASLSVSMLITAGPATSLASSSNVEININQNELEAALTTLYQTPDNLLENEDELEKYLSKKNIYFVDSEEEANKILESRTNMVTTYGAWEDAKCIGSIALFISGAGATISGVKTLVKAAGGVKALASALLLYLQTGNRPEFIKNEPSLWEVFGTVGGAITTVTGLDNCVQEAS
jgi:hypothetical protein